VRYIVEDEERRQNSIDYIKKQNLIQPIEVHIKEYKKNRSRSQNDTMWMWYKDIGDHIGCTQEELHLEVKIRVFGSIKSKIRMFKGDESVWVDLLEGKSKILHSKECDNFYELTIETPKKKSTKSLTTKEMVEFMSAIEMLAIELNVKIRYHDD
jgi:hypothetical protein